MKIYSYRGKNNISGERIREARLRLRLSQTALAAKIDGLTASDIGKAERGEKDLTQAQLKAIAKATGVTQKSLLEAPKGATAAKKTSTSSSAAAKKPASTAKKPAATAKKPAAEEEKLTAAEKTLLKLYRAADADTKKAAVSLLKGEKTEAADLISSLLGGAMDMLSNIGKK